MTKALILPAPHFWLGTRLTLSTGHIQALVARMLKYTFLWSFQGSGFHNFLRLASLGAQYRGETFKAGRRPKNDIFLIDYFGWQEMLLKYAFLWPFQEPRIDSKTFLRLASLDANNIWWDFKDRAANEKAGTFFLIKDFWLNVFYAYFNYLRYWIFSASLRSVSKYIKKF